MGHATHFLRRLDRVSDAHVELALTLYRDEELVREVLSRAGLPEGVERLAVSLEDPVEGPFVILTRSGRFVTCLGKGMRVSDDEKHGRLMVLSRDRLDAAVGRVERMRERFAEVARLKATGGEGVAARAFRRMQEDAFRFPREQAEVLLGVLPLVARECAITLFELQPALLNVRRQVGYMRFDRLTSVETDLALAFGNAFCALGHLLVLTHHEDAYAATEILSKYRIASGGEDALDERALQCAFAFGLGTFSHALRAIWALARRGKKVLPALKAIDDGFLLPERIMRELGLASLAIASPKLRAEATKAMWQLPRGVDPSSLAVLDRSASTAAAAARVALDDPEGMDRDYLTIGRAAAAQLLNGRGEFTDDEAANVQEDIARSLYPGVFVSWFGAESALLQVAATGLPFLARARPEELFLPESFLEHLPPHGIDTVASIVEPFAERYGLDRPAPHRREGPKVGRNDPCTCGSGRKFKRCCGTVGAT